MTPSRSGRRTPIRAIGVAAARTVRKEIGYHSPTDLEIEVLSYMRGALVRPSTASGARANLIRVGERGVIGVAADLAPEERRWAIAHELGHFEAHAGVSFLGLCSSDDLVSAYEASGREPEANAFAAELLMPEDIFGKRCDLAKVSWTPIRHLAAEFQVSLTAAALRFVSLSEDRVAVVCAKEGYVRWSSASKDFGPRPRRGARVGEWTEAHAFFKNGAVSDKPETVSGSAWIDSATDDDELVEHVFAMPRYKSTLSLLWWRS